MSEENTVNDMQLAVNNEGGRLDGGDSEERGVDVSKISELKGEHAEEIRLLREQVEELRDAVKEGLSMASEGESARPVKTAGVRMGRAGLRSVLESAALAARQSGKRGDVQEYLRIRRQCV